MAGHRDRITVIEVAQILVGPKVADRSGARRYAQVAPFGREGGVEVRPVEKRHGAAIGALEHLGIDASAVAVIRNLHTLQSPRVLVHRDDILIQ